MKSLIFLFSIISTGITFGQTLTFSSVNYEPAICRTASFQNGHGSVEAIVTGGTTPYTYLWTQISTGMTHDENTWTNLSAGNYEIKVTDAVGENIIQTVFLDSINVKADFDVLTEGLVVTPSGIIGFAPIVISYKSTSTGLLAADEAPGEEILYWDLGRGDNILSTDQTETQSYNYTYGGEFDVCVTVRNSNNCADTTCSHFGLFGTLVGIDETSITGGYSINPSHSQKNITVTNGSDSETILFIINDLSGKEIKTETLSIGKNSIPFNQPKGLYIYQFYNLSTNVLLNSGKFHF